MGVGIAAGALLIPSSPAVRLTIASAYVALALIAATLLVSPLAALRGRRATASSDVRRDLGIWAGIVSLAHVGLGLWARFGQAAYPVEGRAAALLVAAGGLIGAAGTAATLVLLALSNDAAIRWLGLPRWKRVQRAARWLPALVGAHGVAWLLARPAPVAAAMLVAPVLALAALRAAAATAGGPPKRPLEERREGAPEPCPPATCRG